MIEEDSVVGKLGGVKKFTVSASLTFHCIDIWVQMYIRN